MLLQLQSQELGKVLGGEKSTKWTMEVAHSHRDTKQDGYGTAKAKINKSSITLMLQCTHPTDRIW